MHALRIIARDPASRARAGNWLPTGGIERYVLVWRFYDSPIGVATRTAKESPMPAIVWIISGESELAGGRSSQTMAIWSRVSSLTGLSSQPASGRG